MPKKSFIVIGVLTMFQLLFIYFKLQTETSFYTPISGVHH